MRDVWIKSSRPAIWIGGLVVIIGLALSAQVFSLFGKLNNKDRAIRLLSAEVERQSAAPVQAGLAGRGSEALSLRLRLRSKDTEIRELSTALMLRGGELDTARKKLGERDGALRSIKARLEATESKLQGLLKEKKSLEGQLALLRAARARDLSASEGEIAALKRKNKQLAESVSNLRQDVQTLAERNRKLIKPRLPKEAREKIEDFGGR